MLKVRFCLNNICLFFSCLFCGSDLIKEVLSLDNEIHKLAQELYQQKSVLIMGRGYHYATCLEGALVSQDGDSDTGLSWFTGVQKTYWKKMLNFLTAKAIKYIKYTVGL